MYPSARFSWWSSLLSCEFSEGVEGVQGCCA
jgi:hypothetical protein